MQEEEAGGSPEAEAVKRTFPLRAAGIDVGSNAMRLLIGEFTGPDTWVPLVEQRVPIRLGAEVFGPDGGTIGEAAMEAAVEALASFRQRMDELEVQCYRAAATSAVREARNGTKLVQRVREQAGIRLEVISGGEEARVVWLGVGGRVALAGRRWIMVDLGGGSVEVALAEGDAVLRTESHAMGSVRLLAELGDALRSPRRFRKLAGEYIATLVSRIAIDPGQVDGVIATGGNIEELARLAGAKGDDGVSRLPLDDLHTVIDELAELTSAQRIERYGLRPDRADVVLPAALVYERIGRLTNAEELLVPNVGMKEGLLLDAVNNVLRHTDHNDRQERDLLAGAVALGRRYLFDEAHARHVADLAVSLFDQLTNVHGLDRNARRILMAGALLHDVGQFISYRRHHKHSFYLISQASMPDLTPRETLLVAIVARYHRRAEPSTDHELFGDLDDEEQHDVTWLAALLRIADALDRQHRQHVVNVRARAGKDQLILEVVARGDVMLEEWSIAKKAQLITRAFGLKLEIRINDAD